ncbi:hypothetical protein ACP6EK_04875 [Candidatus Caldatribacterium sp. SIUC1]|uniref:hypothetical protein n=1 Tax=Candidatus Caldatribacterium sp. SIUC1 TaxID=3418365 RepID=UPI003F692F97
MKKATKFLVIAVVVGVLLALVGGCFQEARVPSVKGGQGQGGGGGGQGQSGTTLLASKTATGFWEKVITYNWTLTKTAKVNSDGSITYTLTATRAIASETEAYGVRGTITVTNGGAVATENLTLVDQVEYKTGAGQFQDLPGASQTITPSTQLGPGDTKDYPYEITFTPVEGAIYRNTVKVTITNHSGHLNEAFGPEPKADFSLPSEPTIAYIDETATIEDDFTCPEGFTCTIDNSGPWTVGDAGGTDQTTWTITYTVTLKEAGFCSDKEGPQTVTLENIATLIESDSEEERPASAAIGIGWNCAITGGGCTYTLGYWKNHPGMWPAGSNPRAEFFKSGQTWLEVLKTPPRGNAYYILAHQYIAAQLNILNGASSTSEVNEAIAWAKEFFGEYGPTSTIPRDVRNLATSYASLLDEYNNGDIGPGHCSTEQKTSP